LSKSLFPLRAPHSFFVFFGGRELEYEQSRGCLDPFFHPSFLLFLPLSPSAPCLIFLSRHPPLLGTHAARLTGTPQFFFFCRTSYLSPPPLRSFFFLLRLFGKRFSGLSCVLPGFPPNNVFLRRGRMRIRKESTENNPLFFLPVFFSFSCNTLYVW